MEEVIKAVAEALSSLKIRYVVIGGIAASVWGRPRMTLDLDVVTEVSPEKVPTLLENLQERGFNVSATAQARLLRMLPVKMKRGRLSVDLRIASYSLDQQALARAVAVRVFDTSLLMASREDIIAYKVARFEDLDRADIKAIILRGKKKLDREYIMEACRRLAQETGDEKILANLETVLTWL